MYFKGKNGIKMSMERHLTSVPPLPHSFPSLQTAVLINFLCMLPLDYGMSFLLCCLSRHSRWVCYHSQGG